MGERKHRLLDCNPRWDKHVKGDHAHDVLEFDCPEGHDDCSYAIPLQPWHPNGWGWNELGFDRLSLSPSVANRPKFDNEAAAKAAVDRPDLVHGRMWCHCHVVITDGKITFCPDSK